MGKKQENTTDLFDIFKLDRNDPHINCFIEPWSTALYKCYKAFENGDGDSDCFYDFVNAFSYFYNMPVSSQKKCKELLEFLDKLWVRVSNSTIHKFCQICSIVSSGKMKQCDELSTLCMEIVQAIFVFGGKIPQTQSIFDAAYQAAMSGKISSAKCVALLYILCSRLWRISFGFSCIEENIMLSEAIKYHFLSMQEEKNILTELYAIIIAYAIHDIICARRENGESSPDTQELVMEAYRLLSHFDTQATNDARKILYTSTGIAGNIKDEMEDIIRFMPPHNTNMLN